MPNLEFEPTVVIPDVHGRPELLERVDIRYPTNRLKFVLCGDIMDGPNVPETIDAAQDLRAQFVLGNHEWTYLGAMDSADKQDRYDWTTMGLRPIAQGVFESYLLEPIVTPAQVLKLRERMSTKGHFQYIKSGKIFYETTYLDEQENPKPLVVTHAGLTGTIWAMQKNQIRFWEERRIGGDYGKVIEGPSQVMGRGVVSEEQLVRKNSKNPREPKVVRGHFERPDDFERVSANGMLVDLGSEVKNRRDVPFFVYENWSDQVVRLDPARSLH